MKREPRKNNVEITLSEASLLCVVKGSTWPSSAEVMKDIKAVNFRVPKTTTLVMALKRLESKGLVKSERKTKNGRTRYRYKMTRAGNTEFRRTQVVMRRLMR